MNNVWDLGDKGSQLIKMFEGLKLNAYRCPAGVLTIGYGHTKGVKEGDSISLEEAERLFRKDIEIYEDAVVNAVIVPLNQNQFDALVSFTYNLGAGNLRSSTLLKKLNEGDYLAAADQFSRWNRAGGQVLAGLVRRRAAERDLFLLPV